MLTKSNAKAFAVLSIIYDNLSEELVKDLVVEPYLNGRENGFAVYLMREDVKNVKFVFSEHRRSDDIVVYRGNIYDFNMLGNGLTEEIYQKCEFFPCNQYYEAASYIVTYLMEKKS